ncbi:MAG: HD domain-containing phosphohydrolase [Mycobacterium leprae]
MANPDLWRSLFCSSSDGLFELAEGGCIGDANPTFLAWLGTERASVTGCPLARFVRPPFAARWLNGDQAWSGYLRLFGQGGDLFVSVTITPVTRGGPVRALGVARRLPSVMPMAEEIRRKIDELDTVQLVTVNSIARLAEFYDPDVIGHLERVRLYSFTLAGYLKESTGIFTETQVIQLSRSAVLHDVGKVAVPQRILLKPGRLLPDEWEEMKRHAAFGGMFLDEADTELQRLLGVDATFLSTARDVARWHHERYDGKGYPDGLAGEAIPFSARVVALADVYDALTSRRVYKPAWTPAEAHQLIARERGAQFDPSVVDAFLATEEVLLQIYGSMQPDNLLQVAEAR